MPTIYTVGYSRLREPRRLLVLLDELDALVLDVRLKPWTRFEGWSKKDLEALFGTRYRWIEAFGNDNYAGGDVRLHDPARGLAEVSPLLATHSVILLCGCADPTRCHRSTVAAVLAAAPAARSSTWTAGNRGATIRRLTTRRRASSPSGKRRTALHPTPASHNPPPDPPEDENRW